MQYLIYSTYDAFLADRDMVTYTANLRGAKKFKSYNEAFSFAVNLEKDNKLSYWCVLAIPEHSLTRI